MKTQIKAYVAPETKIKLKELTEHYNTTTEMGKISQSDVTEKAIKDLYEREFGNEDKAN